MKPILTVIAPAAVVEWFDRNPDGKTQSMKDWQEVLGFFRPPHCDAWPRSAKGLGDALRRSAPALRQMGIECRSLPKMAGVIRWEIKPKMTAGDKYLEEPSPTSPASPIVPLRQDMGTFRTSYG